MMGLCMILGMGMVLIFLDTYNVDFDTFVYNHVT